MKLMLFMMVFAGALSIGIAGFLCCKGVNGWGWFLFVGLLILSGIEYTEK